MHGSGNSCLLPAWPSHWPELALSLFNKDATCSSGCYSNEETEQAQIEAENDCFLNSLREKVKKNLNSKCLEKVMSKGLGTESVLHLSSMEMVILAHKVRKITGCVHAVSLKHHKDIKCKVPPFTSPVSLHLENSLKKSGVAPVFQFVSNVRRLICKWALPQQI